jgi:hypothetical protein
LNELCHGARVSETRANGYVGFLRSASPKGFTAYDAASQLLGLFQDKQAAVEAITAST